jgi:hypothetical protein
MNTPPDSRSDSDDRPVVHQNIGSAGRDATQVGRDYVSGSKNRTKISLMITLMVVFGGMAAAFGVNKIQDFVNSQRDRPAETTTAE